MLIRRLVAIRFTERATALALTEEGALQETGLGGIELGLARPGRATRHFERALALAPDASEAVAGMLASRTFDLTQGTPVAAISEPDLDDRFKALIAGWRYAAANEWDAVARLDAVLGRIELGEALFEEASRLRARAAIAAGQPEAAWGSLNRVVRILPKHPRAEPLRKTALEIAESLPEEMTRDLLTRLRAGNPRAAAP